MDRSDFRGIGLRAMNQARHIGQRGRFRDPAIPPYRVVLVIQNGEPASSLSGGSV
jgi:hypothetical protein